MCHCPWHCHKALIRRVNLRCARIIPVLSSRWGFRSSWAPVVRLVYFTGDGRKTWNNTLIFQWRKWLNGLVKPLVKSYYKLKSVATCCNHPLVFMPRNHFPAHAMLNPPKGEPLHLRRIWWSHSISGASVEAFAMILWVVSPHPIRWIYIILLDISITFSLGWWTMVSFYSWYMQVIYEFQ